MNLVEDNKAVEEQDAAVSRRNEAMEYKDKGNTFVKSKEYESAIKMYTRAIDLDDQVPVFFSNRSQCFLSLEKFKECIEDTDKAIALDPKSTKSYYRQTVAYESLGDDFRAFKSCRHWLDLSPEDKACKNAYDRIHNRIMEAEKKKDKEKIRWSRLGSDTEVVNFVTKPLHLNSKRSMKNVPVRLRKAHSPIPESVIDKIFDNNTGETVLEPETDSKLFKPNFLQSSEPSKKIAKLEEKAAVPLTSEKSKEQKTAPKIDEKEKRVVIENNQPLNHNGSKTSFPSLNELEDLYPGPITIPSNGPKFFIAWEQLDEARRFLLLKKLAENHVPIGKLAGAQLDSRMLSEIISIIHKYFKAHQLPYIDILAELGKNSEVPILSMFLESQEKKSKRKKLDVNSILNCTFNSRSQRASRCSVGCWGQCSRQLDWGDSFIISNLG